MIPPLSKAQAIRATLKSVRLPCRIPDSKQWAAMVGGRALHHPTKYGIAIEMQRACLRTTLEAMGKPRHLIEEKLQILALTNKDWRTLV